MAWTRTGHQIRVRLLFRRTDGCQDFIASHIGNFSSFPGVSVFLFPFIGKKAMGYREQIKE